MGPKMSCHSFKVGIQNHRSLDHLPLAQGSFGILGFGNHANSRTSHPGAGSSILESVKFEIPELPQVEYHPGCPILALASPLAMGKWVLPRVPEQTAPYTCSASTSLAW